MLLCGLLATRLLAAERLVYAVTHGGFLHSTTEVFSISSEGTPSQRVFTDDSTPLLLTQPQTSAVLGSRMFTPGIERPARSNVRATGIYEVSLDGSERYRKIFDLPAGERIDWLTVAGDGTKMAYLSLSSNALTLFIHDVKAGSLLRKLDMGKIAGPCPVRNLGWLSDNKTLLFTLQEGADGFMEDADYKHIGLWRMQDDGTALTQLPPSFGVVQEPGYRYFRNNPPVMLGVIDGEYLLQVPLQKISLSPPFNSFLALSDPHSGKTTKIVLSSFLSAFTLSRSGRYIAYIQQEPSKFVGNKHIVPTEHVWIQPLPAGDPKEMFSMETGQERGMSLALIGWMGE